MCRSTYPVAESRSGANEETSTDGTPNGNHMEMARLHGGIQIADRAFAALERLEGQAVASPEAQLVEFGHVGPQGESVRVIICGSDVMLLIWRR